MYRKTGWVCGMVLAAMCLCQCKTVQTVTKKRSSFSINQGEDDSSAMRSKFADRGYSITEDGRIQADRPDLFANKVARGTSGEFGTKTARFKKQEARTHQFRTPEYLKRQEFRGVTAAREGGQAAREGNFQQQRNSAAGKLFQRKTTSTADLGSFGTSAYRSGNDVYTTRASRYDTAPAPRADGVQQTAGYKSNTSMSMDDVKKMLNPSAYARAAGLQP